MNKILSSALITIILTSCYIETTQNEFPQAIIISDEMIMLGSSATFSAEGSKDTDGEITDYQWDFGDNSTANGKDVLHSYTSAGTYTITLHVTDNNGDSDIKTSVIEVVAAREIITDSVDDRFLTIPFFDSEILNKNKYIEIYLPESYGDNPDKNYPVLYANDGQWFFSNMMHEVPDSLVSDNKIEEIIIVSIHVETDPVPGSDFDIRYFDYTMENNAPEYIEFIATELLPFINENYRTKTEPENTAVYGASLGGVISFHLPWIYPELFGKAALISPSVFVDDFLMSQTVYDAHQNGDSLPAIKWWIEVGGNEGDDVDIPSFPEYNIHHLGYNGLGAMEELAYGLTNSLLDCGYVYGESLLYNVGFGHTHGDPRAGYDRFDDSLLFFFGKDDNLVVDKIEVSSSLDEVSLSAQEPNFFLYVKEYYINGMEIVVPLSELNISSSNNDYFYIEDNLIYLDKSVITETTTFTIDVEYHGLSTSCNITVINDND